MDNKVVSLAAIRNGIEGLQAKLGDERQISQKARADILEALNTAEKRIQTSLDTARAQIADAFTSIASVIADEMGERDKALGEALETTMEAAE